MTTRDQALDALSSLNPAPVFLDAYHVQRLPEGLDIYFGCPEEFFLAADTQAAYDEGRLVPILDDGNFGVVTFYDPSCRGLMQKHVESPSETMARYTHWQQYLADLAIRIGESVEDDDRGRRMAGLIGFRHFGALMRFLDAGRGKPPEEYFRRKSRFIESIGP